MLVRTRTACPYAKDASIRTTGTSSSSPRIAVASVALPGAIHACNDLTLLAMPEGRR